MAAKNKVIFVLGAMATGKSKLSNQLAKQFDGEVIYSDKIQVYPSLGIVDDEVTDEESPNVPQRLFKNDEHDDGFGLDDLCYSVLKAIDKVVNVNGHVPIVASGSTSYLEKLVEEPGMKFLEFFDCCFIWLDVSLPVLSERLRERIDEMVTKGTLVNEAKAILFETDEADYSRDIRRVIKATEMESYLMVEKYLFFDQARKDKVLAKAIEDIKTNTRSLIGYQVVKIKRLRDELRWRIHRIDATDVYEKHDEEEAEEIWKRDVLNKSIEIAEKFLLY